MHLNLNTFCFWFRWPFILHVVPMSSLALVHPPLFFLQRGNPSVCVGGDGGGGGEVCRKLPAIGFLKDAASWP